MPSDLGQYPTDEVVGMIYVLQEKMKKDIEWQKILLKSNGAKIK